jgi:acetyl-CoA carboxylase carboxyl transferase subunit alpha
MMEHAYYSVISPEGCAAILWKSAEHASTAANSLKFTAKDLLRLKLIDEVIKEPLGGAHRDPAAAAAGLERFVVDSLRELKRVKIDALVRRRYKKWRHIALLHEREGRDVGTAPRRPPQARVAPKPRAKPARTGPRPPPTSGPRNRRRPPRRGKGL